MDSLHKRVYKQNGDKKVSKNKSSKKCSKVQILREGYKTKTGKKVKSSCIKAQSATGKKTSKILKKYIEKKESKQKQSRQKFPKEAKIKCIQGEIKREGYYKKSHTSHSKSGKKINVKGHWVAPGCILSVMGRSTKGPKLITLMEKDVLKSFGYTKVENITKSSRQKALKKAIQTIKPLSIYRRIIAIATLNKNKNDKLYKILREDAKWIKTQPEYIKQKTSKKTSKNLSKKTSKKM